MEYCIHRTDDVPLSFEGEAIAFVSTNKSRGQYKSRWTELTLYMTKGGKFISESAGMSTHPGEVNIISAEVFDDIESALSFFRNKNGEFTWATSAMVKKVQEVFPDVKFNFGVTVE